MFPACARDKRSLSAASAMSNLLQSPGGSRVRHSTRSMHEDANFPDCGGRYQSVRSLAHSITPGSPVRVVGRNPIFFRIGGWNLEGDTQIVASFGNLSVCVCLLRCPSSS